MKSAWLLGLVAPLVAVAACGGSDSGSVPNAAPSGDPAASGATGKDPTDPGDAAATNADAGDSAASVPTASLIS